MINVIGFWFCSTYKSIVVLALPWISCYILLEIGFLIITLRKMKIPTSKYLRSIIHPLIGSAAMVSICYVFRLLFVNNIGPAKEYLLLYVISSITVSIITYGSYIGLFQQDIIKTCIRMIKERQ